MPKCQELRGGVIKLLELAADVIPRSFKVFTDLHERRDRILQCPFSGEDTLVVQIGVNCLGFLKESLLSNSCFVVLSEQCLPGINQPESFDQLLGDRLDVAVEKESRLAREIGQGEHAFGIRCVR